MPSTCISQRLNALRVSGTASSSSFVDFREKCQDCCAEYCFEYGGGRGRRAIAKRLHWAPWMGHSYLGESPRCHIVGSTTLNILQQGWDCNRFLNCASVEKDVGKLGKKNKTKQASLQSLWKGWIVKHRPTLLSHDSGGLCWKGCIFIYSHSPSQCVHFSSGKHQNFCVVLCLMSVK